MVCNLKKNCKVILKYYSLNWKKVDNGHFTEVWLLMWKWMQYVSQVYQHLVYQKLFLKEIQQWETRGNNISITWAAWVNDIRKKTRRYDSRSILEPSHSKRGPWSCQLVFLATLHFNLRRISACLLMNLISPPPVGPRQKLSANFSQTNWISRRNAILKADLSFSAILKHRYTTHMQACRDLDRDGISVSLKNSILIGSFEICTELEHACFMLVSGVQRQFGRCKFRW
jgi:hypothetical protein